MAIKIKSLKVDTIKDTPIEKGYLYKDFDLNFNPELSYNTKLNKSESLRDVSALYDINAVKNSITNAFLTAPGENILDPNYGVDIRQYLFEPVNDFIAELIKETIESKLPDMEPRVVVNNVDVIPNEDDNEFLVNLQIDVPSLNVYGLSIKSTLGNSGYVVY